MGKRAVGSVLKVSLDSPDHLDSKETEELQVYLDLQELQDFQPSVVVVCLDLQVSPEREARKENLDLQDSHCRVPQDALGLLDCRDHQGPPDLQASPLEEEAASRESLDVLDCKESEATPERRARKVKRATPV